MVEMKFLGMDFGCALGSLSNGEFPEKDCLLPLISKLLGYCIVAASTTVKLPQILKILKNSSVRGLSILSFELEVVGYTIALAYCLHKGLPFSAYGELAFLLLQGMASTAPTSGATTSGSHIDLPHGVEANKLPPDTDLVEVFNPKVDHSYVHIPLSSDVTALLFPVATMESNSLLLNKSVSPPFDYPKFKSLPRGDINWNTWVARLKKFDSNVWRKQGIYQLIQMTTLDITFDLDLLEGSLRWWAPLCNSFVFPCGPMSLTLYDILHFTGLPIIGNDYASLINSRDLPHLAEKYQNPSSYSQVIKQWYSLKRTSPTSDERICFMWVLICKFLFGPSSGKPTIEYLSLARSLSIGDSHGLGVMFLGATYRWLNVAVSEAPFSRLNGILWLLQMWLFFYFPELAAPPNSPPCSMSWKELMACTSDLAAHEVFAFFQSLSYSRFRDYPLPFTFGVEALPWVEHLSVENKISTSSLVDTIRNVVRHPRFLVPDGTPLHDSSTHSFEFYNPSLYPFQLGFCPRIPVSELHLPHALNEMTISEIAKKKLTSLALLEFSEQVIHFKNPIIRLPISITDAYLPWWNARYGDLVPKSIKASALVHGKKRKWDLAATRQSKKSKSNQATPLKETEILLKKRTAPALPPRRRTRSSAVIFHEVSRPQLTEPKEIPIQGSSDSHSTSGGGSKTESDTETEDSHHFSLAPLPENLNPATDHPSIEDLSARRSMVSLAEEDIDFDFSFLVSGPIQTTSSSTAPTGLELATAKAFLKHFLNMSLHTLGAMERSTIMSAVSILKASPDFSDSPIFTTLDTLSGMFSAFQESSTTCSDTLVQLGEFKAQKEKLDGMLLDRKATAMTLQHKMQEFDGKAELVKMELEIAQHRADMRTLLQDSENLKTFSTQLKTDIQRLGDNLVSQKQAYQGWEETLKSAEATRADCLLKWEELKTLDLS